MKDKKILIIEDEFHISEAIKLNLEILGAKCSVASDGTMGIDQWSNDKFDLIILDIMLPLMDGISVLKRIRSVDTQIPVVILSAKSDVEDRILGLENKADDYLGKPFNLKELLLRCEVLLKRKNAPVQEIDDVFNFGANQINWSKGEGKRHQEVFNLTEQELRLLKVMISNEGKFLTREYLYSKAWEGDENVKTRTVDNFISRFRRYFEENPKQPNFFISRRLRGYQFNSMK